jgi:hypothetical protein
MTMTRFSWRPVLAVGLAAATLAYFGCGRTFQTPEPGQASKKAPAPSSGEASPAGDESSSSSKLFADWKGLQAAIVITGEMFGYLDPCGCTEGQLGGLGRRLDLLDRMDAQKIPSARIDLGGLTKDPADARGGRVQAKVKFTTAIHALQRMKYAALALAPEDLKFGVFDTLGLYLNEKDKLPITSANVAVERNLAETFPGLIRSSVVAQAGPYKVGVTAVVDPAWYARLKDNDLSMLEVKPPEAVLGDALKKLEGESDLQVLMVQGPPEMAKDLGAKFPGFDVIVATSPVPDPDGRAEPINGGATQVVQVGQQGKYVGVVGLFGDPKKGPPSIRYQKVSLNGQKYRNAEPMRVLIDETMQQELKALRVVEDFPRTGYAAAPAGSVYVGAETCKSCHPNAYAKWQSTPHSHAFETLIHNPKDPRRVREFDAECVTCHTTGFTYKSGWVSAEKTPNLKGNQCENCHGPASKHVEQPTNKDFLAPMHREAAAAEKGFFCQKCHDTDNSPHFDFKAYYPRIDHKGLDKLDDPKVRQGVPPVQARAGG